MMRTQCALMMLISLVFGVSTAEDGAGNSIEAKLAAAAMEHRLPLGFDGKTFSGPAWEKLVDAGKNAQFFLVGEEHGIAENPKLVAQLFVELSNHGYSRLAIEVSPAMASQLDAAAAAGLDGLRSLFSQPGGEPAFFGMAEEADMLAAVRAAVPDSKQAFWGTDYEVASDRQLIAVLERTPKPAAAEAALETLANASASSWAQWYETGSPQYIFSFAGDPALVSAVREAWPGVDSQSATILNTLEQTLAINRLWVQGRAWESNRQRAALQRQNFLRYWNAAKQNGETPKVMAKYGSSHMVRGLSQTAVYDLGTLLPEIAAIEGGHSVSVMVLPGRESQVAGLNPSNWSYAPRSAKDGYDKGIDPLVDAAFEKSFTLIDLVSLRPIIGMRSASVDDELFRVVHGFDMLLVMSGSTPSGELVHD